MHEHKANRTDSFHLIAQEVFAEAKSTSKASPKTIARDLGVQHQTVLRWLRNDKYHMPAEKLPQLCRILGNFKLLDALEEQAGRVAFPVPEKEPLAAADVIAVQRLVKEVGGALQCLAETLEDHIVEEREVEKTVPELDDVIRECVRLQYWLRERSRVDRKKTKSTKPIRWSLGCSRAEE